MKLLASALLAASLALTATTVGAEDTAKKVGKGAENAGKTVIRGASAVGKGGSKIYHDVAAKTHKVVAGNAKSDRAKGKHLTKAAIHYNHANTKGKQSKKAMGKAGTTAKKVVP